MKDKTKSNAQPQWLVDAKDFNERLVVLHVGHTEGGAGYYKDSAAFKRTLQINMSLLVICLAARSDLVSGEYRTAVQLQGLIDAHPNIV